MENRARIRINLQAKEVEIEGTEEFVKSHSEFIEGFLKTIATQNRVSNSQGNLDKDSRHSGNDSEPLTETFGEYFHQLPRETTDSAKILVAGHFAQKMNSENSFTTKDASKLLLEQGVKLSNSTAFIKSNLDQKYLIKLSKGVFRVSRDGSDFIKSLFSRQ